jgi:hypothetical protein
MHKSMFLLFAALAFTACAESRYRSNLQNAPVTRWTDLSRADYEQAVRLVSDSTHQPIVGITTDGVRRDPTHLHIITGFYNSDLQRWTGFHLEKRSKGWHITARHEISRFLAQMILSDPPKT